MIVARRFHDIACGHRVVGHEGKCRYIHGHNYRVHFELAPQRGVDHLGRVLDFGVIKSTLCEWLEVNWDHKFLAWDKDTELKAMCRAMEPDAELKDSFVWVPFNPTAEAMASHLRSVIGPRLLILNGVRLSSVMIEETRKCWVEDRE